MLEKQTINLDREISKEINNSLYQMDNLAVMTQYPSGEIRNNEAISELQ